LQRHAQLGRGDAAHFLQRHQALLPAHPQARLGPSRAGSQTLPPPGLQGVWYCSAVGPLPATGGTVRRANLAGDTHDEAPCRARSPAASPNGSRRTAPVCPHAGKPPLSNPPTALERGGPAHRNPFPPRPGNRTSRLDQLTTSPDANLSPLGRSPSQPPSPK